MSLRALASLRAMLPSGGTITALRTIPMYYQFNSSTKEPYTSSTGRLDRARHISLSATTPRAAQTESPRQVRVSHILLPPGQEDLLNEIKSRIESGQSSFSALAKELSACPSGKQGGDIGWIRRGTTVAEFEAASFNASPGDLVTCSTQFGLHLLKVVDQR